jgi:peptide deformylase
MPIRRIVTVETESPVLRTTAAAVARVDERLRQLMDDMIETMRDAPGVGLAAPQVGIGLRVIVVEAAEDPEDEAAEPRLYALANPEIVWADERTAEAQEACLSIPDLFGEVPRSIAIRVRGLDRQGRAIEIEAREFLARVFQHEVDHLDGVLYTDRVTGLDKLYHLREDDEGQLVRVPYALPTL